MRHLDAGPSRAHSHGLLSLWLALCLAAHEGEASRVALLDAAIAEHPDSITLRIERAQSLYRLRRHEDALKDLERAGAHPDALRLRGLVLHALGRDAESAARAFLDGNPPSDDVLRVLSEVLEAKGDLRGAADAEARVAELKPSPDAFLRRGRLLEQAGSPREAAEAYRAGIAKLGDAHVLREALVRVLVDEKDGQGALDAIAPMMRAPSVETWLLHARVAEVLGLHALARVDRLMALALVEAQLAKRPSEMGKALRARVLTSLER